MLDPITAEGHRATARLSERELIARAFWHNDFPGDDFRMFSFLFQTEKNDYLHKADRFLERVYS